MRDRMLVAVIVLLAVTAHDARAESDAVCRDYAREATESFTEAQQRRCPLSNARWQGNTQGHYDWCRNAPTAWVDSERNARRNQLRVCRQEPAAVECDQYALMADANQRSNVGGNCGFTGPRWQDNYDNHLGWCLNVPIATANRELEIRRVMLGVCGNTEPYKRCDAYARTAEAQVREANERNCQFTGARWTPNYEDHLTWCVTQPPEAAANEERERGGPLSQCRTQNPSVGGGETCAWSAVVRTVECLSGDGTPSTARQGQSNLACGPTQDVALTRAKLGLEQAGCLSDGDDPAPGCCTVTEETSSGCSCR